MSTSPIRRVLIRCLYLTAICFPLVSLATPSTPANFHHQIYSRTAAEVFWDRSTNVPTRGYELVRNGEILGEIDALSYFDDTLIEGVKYTYSVTAVGYNGERSGTAVLSLYTPKSTNTIESLMNQVISLQQEIADLESLPDSDVRSPVPVTGQKTSWLPGDDGDYQAGQAWPSARFTVNVNNADDLNENGVCDNGESCNGTVRDNLTGLVWLQNANCFDSRGWTEAISEANLLTDDGTSPCGLSDGSQAGDWRVPNVKEIQSLMDYGHEFPTALLPADHPFVDVQIGGINERPASYWTSTSTGPGNSGVYTVSLSVGWVERWAIPGSTANFYIWPVKWGM